MGKTAIEWTERSWNPVTGCSKVSPGCTHCYAEAISLRFKRSVGPWTGANARANVVLHPERLEEPLKVRKPSMFFTCSMGDLFHELVPWDFIVQVFDMMAAIDWHTYQVLTKRPGRMAYFAEHIWPKEGGRWEPIRPIVGNKWPGTAWPSNIWAGTSVESAKYLPRLDVLARVPAKVRFVSAEPLLGPLDLRRWLTPFTQTEVTRLGSPKPQYVWNGGINWVIAGGESGPGFRAPDLDWFLSLRDQCQAAGVPFFFKQWGGSRPGGPALLDGREWRQMP